MQAVRGKWRTDMQVLRVEGTVEVLVGLAVVGVVSTQWSLSCEVSSNSQLTSNQRA